MRKGTKRSSSATSEENRPEKRARVLLSEDSDGETSIDESQTGFAYDKNVLANNYVLSVNEDFARRFEHNKKREELQQRKHTWFLTLGQMKINAMRSRGEIRYSVYSFSARIWHQWGQRR